MRAHQELGVRLKQVGFGKTVGCAAFGRTGPCGMLVGEPPLQYLTRWRMHKAAGMLRAGPKSLGEIAGRIGYEAEAAFSKAFKRWAGHAPGAYRHSSRLAGTDSPR